MMTFDINNLLFKLSKLDLEKAYSLGEQFRDNGHGSIFLKSYDNKRIICIVLKNASLKSLIYNLYKDEEVDLNQVVNQFSLKNKFYNRYDDELIYLFDYDENYRFELHEKQGRILRVKFNYAISEKNT